MPVSAHCTTTGLHVEHIVRVNGYPHICRGLFLRDLVSAAVTADAELQRLHQELAAARARKYDLEDKVDARYSEVVAAVHAEHGKVEPS